MDLIAANVLPSHPRWLHSLIKSVFSRQIQSLWFCHCCPFGQRSPLQPGSCILSSPPWPLVWQGQGTVGLWAPGRAAALAALIRECVWEIKISGLDRPWFLDAAGLFQWKFEQCWNALHFKVWVAFSRKPSRPGILGMEFFFVSSWNLLFLHFSVSYPTLKFLKNMFA